MKNGKTMDYQTKFRKHVVECGRCALSDFDMVAMDAYLQHFLKDRSGFEALDALLELAAENPAVAAYLTWCEAYYGFVDMGSRWEGSAAEKADLKRAQKLMTADAW